MNQHVRLLKVILFATLICDIAQAQESLAAPELLTSNEAIEDALSEPLRYIGSYISSSSISRIPSCIFRNSKVTVRYTYCRQKEAPALGLVIYSRNSKRGHVNFYAEGSGQPVSKINRRDYLDAHFRVLARENLPGYKTNFSAKNFGDYSEKESTYYKIGCQVWQWSSDHTLRADCIEPYKAQEKAWLNTSLLFWAEPHAAWYELQNVLRAEVAKTNVP